MIQRKFSIGVCMYGIPLVTAMNASLIFYQEQRVFMCCLWGVFSSKWMSRRVLKACVTTEGTINHRRNKILLKRQSCVRWDSLYQKFPCKLRFCLEDFHVKIWSTEFWWYATFYPCNSTSPLGLWLQDLFWKLNEWKPLV